MISLAVLLDLIAGLSLLSIIAVFGLGHSERVQRLWELKRYEVLLIFALPTLARFADALGRRDVSATLHEAQVGAVTLCAVRLLMSVTKASPRPSP